MSACSIQWDDIYGVILGQVFFTGRSDYFKALLDDHFGESSTDEEHNLPVITLHETTSAIFVQVMYYIYQDSCEVSDGAADESWPIYI